MMFGVNNVIHACNHGCLFPAKPAITIDPITVTTGQTATMTCTAHFGSPLEADMDTAEKPKISMWIGGLPAKSSVLTWSKVRGERSTLKSVSDQVQAYM